PPSLATVAPTSIRQHRRATVGCLPYMDRRRRNLTPYLSGRWPEPTASSLHPVAHFPLSDCPVAETGTQICPETSMGVPSTLIERCNVRAVRPWLPGFKEWTELPTNDRRRSA